MLFWSQLATDLVKKNTDHKEKKEAEKEKQLIRYRWYIVSIHLFVFFLVVHSSKFMITYFDEAFNLSFLDFH